MPASPVRPWPGEPWPLAPLAFPALSTAAIAARGYYLGAWPPRAVPGAERASRTTTDFACMSRRGIAGRSSAVSSTWFPGRSRGPIGKPGSWTSRPSRAVRRAPAPTAAASWATSTFSWSAIAARTASRTTSARSITSSSGRRPAGAGSEKPVVAGSEPAGRDTGGEVQDQARRLIGLLHVGGMPGALDHLDPGALHTGVGLRGLDRIVVELILGAEDHQQRDRGRLHPLAQRLLVLVVVQIGAVVRRVRHRPEVVHDLIAELAEVVAWGERRLVPVTDREVRRDAPDRLAEHGHEPALGQKRQVPVAGVGLLVDVDEPIHQLARLLRQCGGHVETHRVPDDDRPLDIQTAEREGHQATLVLHRVAVARLLGAAEAQQVDADRSVPPLQQRDHLVPPMQRAAKAVKENDRRAAGALLRRAGVRDLQLAAPGDLKDPAALDRHGRALGLVVDDDGVGGDRIDHELDVLVFVNAQLLDGAGDLIAVDLGCERGLLQLLANRLRLHPLDPRGTNQRARGDEPRQLIHRVQGLREPGLPWHAEEVGVSGHRVDDLLRVAA